MRLSKSSTRIILAVVSLTFGVWPCKACNNVFVQSTNGTSASVTVQLGLNALPRDNLGFVLGASGSRIDALPVGSGSLNPLALVANVMTQGSLIARCQVSVVNQNQPGQCSGIVDPDFVLAVTGSSHDKGNHIGAYRRLGLLVGIDVPLHSGISAFSCKFTLVPSF